MSQLLTTGASLVLFVLMSNAAGAQAPVGYDDTPMQPNGTWRVHDGRRPQPPVVTPRVTNDGVLVDGQ